MARASIDHILELPTDERLAIVEEIWESVREHATDVPVSAAQQRELEKRWLAFEQSHDEGEPWEDVKNSLLNE